MVPHRRSSERRSQKLGRYFLHLRSPVPLPPGWTRHAGAYEQRKLAQPAIGRETASSTASAAERRRNLPRLAGKLP